MSRRVLITPGANGIGLAMELGPHGIRANAICPGSVNGPRMVSGQALAVDGMTYNVDP